MAVSYNKLWKLLVDKKMSKSDLRKKAEIAPNTMTKLRRCLLYTSCNNIRKLLGITHNNNIPCTGQCQRTSCLLYTSQLINADISRILDTSISPNIALFASFSKLLVAN